MSFRSIFPAAAAVALITACSGDPCGSLTEPLVVASLQIAPTRLDLRVGQSRQLNGAALTQCNRTIADAPIAWESGDPSVASVSPSGMVTALKVGNTTIRATSEGKSALASVLVSVVPIAEVDIAPGSVSLWQGYDVQLTAHVTDSAGNVVPGQAVSWSSSAPTIASVDGTGLVTGLAVGGPVTISATAGAAVGTTAVTVVRPPATGLVFSVQPTDVAAGVSMAPAVGVTVVDSLGNRIGGDTTSVSLSLGANPGGSTLSGSTVVAAVDGIATFSGLTLDKVGTGYTLVASAQSVTTTSASFAVSHGVAVGFAFVLQPVSTQAGALITAAVRVVDAFGNTVTASNDAIDIRIGTNPNGGTLSGTTTVAAVQGVAAFGDLSIDNVGSGYTLEAGSAGRTPAASNPFDITASAPTALMYTVQPTRVTAGVPMIPDVEVTIADSLGNRIPGDTRTVTVALGTNPGGSTLGGTTVVNAVDGVARFPGLTLDKVGTGYTLLASAAGVAGAGSAPFDVSPNVAVGFDFAVEPTSTQAGALITPAVRVVDIFGNTVTTANDAIDISIGTNPGGGTLSGTTTVTAVQGVAVFSDLSIDKVGIGYTLDATSGGRTPAISNPFDITPAAPAALLFVVEPTTTDHGKSIKPPVRVSVVDGWGNLVDTATTAITMSIAVNPGGGILSGTTTQSAVNGVAVFDDLSIDKNGTGYVLAADALGLTGALSQPFRIK